MNIAEKIRSAFKAGDDIRDAGLKTPEDIDRWDDICYGEDEKWQVLDVYRPKNVDITEKLPVIISYHGGGWVYGDKERYQYYCMQLAQYGFAVVNFTYRLAPEFQFPAPIMDMNAVCRWVTEHEQAYGFDITRIFAVGDSAGAHGLGIYCNLLTNAEYRDRFLAYQQEIGQDLIEIPKDFCLRAVALNCGKYTMDLNFDHPGDTEQVMEVYLPRKGSVEEQNLLTVTDHVTKDFPHAYIMTCSGDFLAQEAPLLVQALTDTEATFEMHFETGESISLGHVFHLNVRSKEGILCNKNEVEFFTRLK